MYGDHPFTDAIFRIAIFLALVLAGAHCPAADESPLADAFQFGLGSANWRTAGGVSSLAYSSNGAHLAACSHDPVTDRGLIYIWDSTTGRRIARFPAFQGRHPRIRYSNNNGELIVGSVISYTVKTGAPRVLKERAFNALDLTSDQRVLAIVEFNSDEQKSQIALWDRETNSYRSRITLDEHEREPVALRFSPRGDSFCLARTTGEVELRSTKDARLIRTFPRTKQRGRDSNPLLLEFSPDETLVALVDYSRVSILSVATGKKIGTLGKELNRSHFSIHSLAWSPDSRRIAFATSGDFNELRVYDASPGELVVTVPQIRGYSPKLAFSPDGKRLAIGGKTIRFLDTATWQEVDQHTGFDQEPSQVVFGPNGKVIATLAKNRLVLWEFAAKRQVRSFEVSQPGQIAFSPDTWAIAHTSPYESKIWQTDTGSLLHTRYSEQFSRAIAPEFDREALLTRFGLSMYDNFSGQKTLDISPSIAGGSPYDRISIRFSPDGRLLAVAAIAPPEVLRATEPDSPGEAAREVDTPVAALSLWDSAFGKHVANLIGRDAIEKDLDQPEIGEAQAFYDGNYLNVVDQERRWGPYEQVEFSPDGLFLAASRCPGEIDLWVLASRRMMGQIYAGEGPFAFSADGRSLLVIGVRRLTLVETATLKPTRRLTWNVERIDTSLSHLGWDDSHLTYPSVGLSPDGNFIALATRDSSPLEIYSLAPSQAKSNWQAATLTETDATALWETLENTDASAAYAAIWRLAAAKNGDEAIASRITVPETTASIAATAGRLVANLSADTARTRQTAQRELNRIADRAEPHLRTALDGSLPAEVKERIEAVLAKLQSQTVRLDRETIRRLRAIQSLERIGSATAVRTLRRLADGEATARETIAAGAALERLAGQGTGRN